MSDGAAGASLGSPEALTSSGGLSGQGEPTQDASTEQVWPAPDELDRKLRRSFLNLLTQMDEATLTAYFTTPEGQRAQALLADFAANHPPGTSSDNANDILNRVPLGVDESPESQS